MHAKSHYVYPIICIEPDGTETILAVELSRKTARASIDAGEWAHACEGKIRIRRARLVMFAS